MFANDPNTSNHSKDYQDLEAGMHMIKLNNKKELHNRFFYINLKTNQLVAKSKELLISEKKCEKT